MRDPRWGRNIESAGEDPFLSGEYAVNFVQGFEHAKEATFPLQSSACCKHFVANELDNSNGTDRDHVNSIVPEQDLVDSYLPSFQACVEEGKVSGIMVSAGASAPARPLAFRRQPCSRPLPSPPVLLQRRQRRAVVRERLAARHAAARELAV